MSAVDYTWNSSTQNAEMEGTLQIIGKPELHCEKKKRSKLILRKFVNFNNSNI